MGFKADQSFLKFLTIGAVGVRETIRILGDEGLQPIELERYCASNKIWATKIKRLRLPDVLCVKTGVRVEVRAKSDLKIRMSDAPDNPERRWDTGLRDDDLVAFVPCRVDESTSTIGIACPPIFFSASELRASVETTKLGPPKSASEGAERDREWPSTVPSIDGQVLGVAEGRIRTILDSGRKQTYQLKNKYPYVAAGERFLGGASIIASTVPGTAEISSIKNRTWDSMLGLQADIAEDRYAAAKAIPHAGYKLDAAVPALDAALAKEPEERVALEMAASSARLGAEVGMARIARSIWEEDREDLQMEGVLILTELKSASAGEMLDRVACDARFAGKEMRQAAVWGLGKQGVRAYDRLVSHIADEDDGVALHAIAAFGNDAPASVVDALVRKLSSGESRMAAAASAALRMIGSRHALDVLVQKARTNTGDRAWTLATIGRFGGRLVREALASDAELLDKVAPLLLLGREDNWLEDPNISNDLDFLVRQNF